VIVPITDDQIRELQAYARHIADAHLGSNCAMALASEAAAFSRDRCEVAYVHATLTPEWAARHLPSGAFRVAEMIAQFLLDEAHACTHLEAVHDKLVDMATRIRTADWIKEGTLT
jgi:hypothetical protein